MFESGFAETTAAAASLDLTNTASSTDITFDHAELHPFYISESTPTHPSRNLARSSEAPELSETPTLEDKDESRPKKRQRSDDADSVATDKSQRHWQSIRVTETE